MFANTSLFKIRLDVLARKGNMKNNAFRRN